MSQGHDPRAVANFVLDVACEVGSPASNLVVNKVVYFIHGAYLAQFGKPLIDARIEAWDYGPVVREIYHEFKAFKERPITSRAKQRNLQTGDLETSVYSFASDEEQFLRTMATSYLKLRPGVLVNLSHVHDGPWHEAWFHDGRVNPGMEISNEAISQHFSSQKRH